MLPEPKTSNMKRQLAKLAVVAVALVGVLSAQSEAAVKHVQHKDAHVHCVVKDKVQHKKHKVRKDKCMCHHHLRHQHGKACVLHVCDAERRRRHHRH